MGDEGDGSDEGDEGDEDVGAETGDVRLRPE
jgi:hypothetical protein